MNKNETVSCVNYHARPEWEPWTGSNRCPNCGGTEIEYNTKLVLTSNPPQSQLRCKSCGHYFSSGFTTEWTDNDSLNKLPKLGDWPPSLTPCDPPYYPNIDAPLNIGWICPKCGRGLAPHLNSCPYCSEAMPINITY